MRPIKLRAWNKEHQFMFKPSSLECFISQKEEGQVAYLYDEDGSSGHIGFYAHCLNIRNQIDDKDRQCALHGLPTDNCTEDFEIIGNIYENPNLLKEIENGC